MAAVHSDLYVAMINAGVPQEQASKLADADTKLDVEAVLIETLKAIGELRQLTIAQTIMKRHRKVLRELAKR